MSIYNDLQEAQTKLKFWKDKELELRNIILEEMASEKDEGAVSKKVDGLKITATYKMSRVIDKNALEDIKHSLSGEELDCIKYSPSVVIKNFRELESEGKSKLLDIVTLKPSQGSIVIKEI